MKHLNESWWRKKSIEKKPLLRDFNKDDMYIPNSKGGAFKETIGSSFKETDKIYGLSFPELHLIKDYKFSTSDFSDRGAFIRNDSEYNIYRFGIPRRNEIWFDLSPTFKRLHIIGDKLGFNLNKNVHITSINKDAKIVEILNFCFYEIDNSYTTGRYIKEVSTLVYKVQDPNRPLAFGYYQINQLELLEDTKPATILEEVIEDNFLELIDDNILRYSVSKTSIKGNESFICKLTILDLNATSLFKIFENLYVAEKRLFDEGYSITINNVTNSDITFTCYKEPSKT
jgi:hypothetical protein